MKYIKYTFKYAIVILVSVIVISQAKAQDGESYVVSDLEAWTEATVKYKINDSWSIGLDNGFRLKSNASVMDQYLTEFNVKYKFTGNFSTAFGFRYILSNDNTGDVQGLEHLNRWNLDGSYKLDLSRFTFDTRLRYQSKKEYGSDDATDNTLRFKLGAEYNIKKWKFDPQFSAEIFKGLTDSEGFNKYRVTVGTEYKIKKAGTISAFYRIEQDLIGLYSSTNYILGLGYKYTIKN
jgi:long-subunit fatty acid transport protein